jgi:hypothetical protein
MTIEFQEELPLNHEPSLDTGLRDKQTTMETGYHSNWDHAYEQAWHGLDAEFNYSYI